MKIRGLKILGKEVEIECDSRDFLSLIAEDKCEKEEVKPGNIEDENRNEKKAEAIKAMKEAVARRKAEKEYTNEDIVRMHDDEGLEMKEIAKITGIPYSTAWQRYHRVVFRRTDISIQNQYADMALYTSQKSLKDYDVGIDG